jgi:hypothetical protein
VSERTWDRVGAGGGLIFVVLGLAGLFGGGLGQSSTGSRPGLDASTEQVVAFMTRPAPANGGLGFALILTAYLFLFLFGARLWAISRNAGEQAGWLAIAGLGGLVLYAAADITRFMVSDARNLAVGHHLQPAEGVAFFDISNALTPVTWAALAMFLIPTALAAVRGRVLPSWLGWAGLVIGLGNLLWVWLPPGGTSTPAEDAALLWILVASIVLLVRPVVRANANPTSG